jgi:hypothetical protein
MLDAIISSKTRIKLLIRFFLNPDQTGYLRGLATEFGESTNGIRIELGKLSGAGLLVAENNGNTILYSANKNHPLFKELHNIVCKLTGVDSLVQEVIARIGDVSNAYVVGDYAEGRDSGIIDLVLVGQQMNTNELSNLVSRAEGLIKRRIRTFCVTNEEWSNLVEKSTFQNRMLIWSK